MLDLGDEVLNEVAMFVEMETVRRRDERA